MSSSLVFIYSIVSQIQSLYIHNDPMDWRSARSYCQNICKSDLVTITSNHTNTALIDQISDNTWIGLYDLNDNDNFMWIDGSNSTFGLNHNEQVWKSNQSNIKISYTSYKNEPHNSDNNCIAYDHLDGWDQKDCTNLNHFACNYCDVSSIYYITPNQFNYQQSTQFCESQCDSNIASIHTDNDQQFAVSLAANGLYKGNDIHIGLEFSGNDVYDETLWSWYDNTTFNYGNDLLNYPWGVDEPDADVVSGRLWGYLGTDWSDSDYVWKTDTDNTTQRAAICNDCSTKINRFILGPSPMTYEAANSYCMDNYGSSLASIHNQIELDAAESLCHLGDGNCWLGLTSLNDTIMTWEDWSISYKGDFNGTLITANTISEKDGVVIDSSSSQWEVFNKSSVNDFLCDIPSEFCYDEEWTEIKDEWSANPFGGCGFWQLAAEPNPEAIIVNTHKKWINSQKTMELQYVFNMAKIDNPDLDGDMGILIYNFESICSYYYIGITTDWKLFIHRIDDGNITVIQEQTMDDMVFEYYRLYMLRIQVTNGNIFSIDFNGNRYMTDIDDINAESRTYEDISGYIGLKSHDIISLSHSLYVSGTALTIKNSFFVDDYSLCPATEAISHTPSPTTTAPTEAISTPDTTIEPTPDPTAVVPTTNYPSKSPSTSNPTTANPTSSTTTSKPTAAPSKSPTVYGDGSHAVTPGPSTTPNTGVKVAENPSNTNTTQEILIFIMIFIPLCCIITGLSSWYVYKKRKEETKSSFAKDAVEMMTPIEEKEGINSQKPKGINIIHGFPDATPKNALIKIDTNSCRNIMPSEFEFQPGIPTIHLGEKSPTEQMYGSGTKSSTEQMYDNGSKSPTEQMYENGCKSPSDLMYENMDEQRKITAGSEFENRKVTAGSEFTAGNFNETPTLTAISHKESISDELYENRPDLEDNESPNSTMHLRITTGGGQ